MNSDIFELEEMIKIQENYFENILRLGLMLEKNHEPLKAIDVYKKGVEKAEEFKANFLWTMAGLYD
jgi:hypothetical protein